VKKIILLILIFIISSCKFQEVKVEDLKTRIDGIEVQNTRDFSDLELQIARRVCTNLQKKREYFETLYNMTEKFKFIVETKSCGAKPSPGITFEAYISNTNSTYLEYSSNQENSFRDIVTDQNGQMKSFCDIIFKPNKVSNTINFNSYQLIYNVLINNGYDRVETAKQVKNIKGVWELVGIEAVDFISQKSQGPAKFFGVEKERTRKIYCDGTNFTSLKQTWIEATTNFPNYN